MKKFILVFFVLFLIGCSDKYIEGPMVIPSDIKIEEKTYVDEYEEYLDRYLDSFINDKTILIPHYLDKDIVWVVESGNAKIENNVIYKTENSNEYENISLRAFVGDTSYLFENIELIDPYVGYLMTYFIGDGLKNEKVFYAWTYDGTLWYQINFQKPILSATIGTRRLRDPSFIRKKNGEFTLVATEGFDNPDIFAFDTTNFKDFENERLIKLNSSVDDSMSETQAWAPEGFYDRRFDKYVVYWSSPNDVNMFNNPTINNSRNKDVSKITDKFGAFVLRLGNLYDSDSIDEALEDLEISSLNAESIAEAILDDYGDYYNIKSSFTLPDGTETDDEGFYKY